MTAIDGSVGRHVCFSLEITSQAGRDSKQVTDLIRSLEYQAPDQVVALLGNHELLLLRAVHDKYHREAWLTNPENWQTIASWAAAANEELDNSLQRLHIDPLSTQTIAEIYQAAAKSDPDSDSLIPHATQRWRFNHPHFTSNLWEAWSRFCVPLRRMAR